MLIKRIESNNPLYSRTPPKDVEKRGVLIKRIESEAGNVDAVLAETLPKGFPNKLNVNCMLHFPSH